MTSQAVHVLVFDAFADWEPAHALAELRRSGNRSVVAVGFDLKPVTSMGGLRVIPDRALGDIRSSEMEILILPGGDFWESRYKDTEVREIFKQLRIFSAADEELWFDMFRHGRFPQPTDA